MAPVYYHYLCVATPYPVSQVKQAMSDWKKVEAETVLLYSEW